MTDQEKIVGTVVEQVYGNLVRYKCPYCAHVSGYAPHGPGDIQCGNCGKEYYRTEPARADPRRPAPPESPTPQRPRKKVKAIRNPTP